MLPNAWDNGSARWLRGKGFQALATTSSGAAWSMGRADTSVPLEDTLAHIRQMVEATDLPVNADFESGFAADVAGVSTNVLRCLETGVAALSIEDSRSEDSSQLYAFETAVERIKAARVAFDAHGNGALLVGRCEVYFTAHANPLQEAIRRLQAYSAAGADVLYAPGVRKPEEIAALVQAVAPKPFNLLIGWGSELSMSDYAKLGVRRISVGGALARAAWAGFTQAAEHLAAGSFAGFAGPRLDLDGFFAKDRREFP